MTPLSKVYASRHVFLLFTDVFTETGHLQTCRPFLCTSPIDITEVNFKNRLLWVIEDQSHQRRVMKKKRLETAGLKILYLVAILPQQ